MRVLFTVICLAMCPAAFANPFSEGTPMESGMLYRVKIGSKHPGCFLAVCYAPAPHELIKDHQHIEVFLLVAADRRQVLQRIEVSDDLDGRDIEIGDFNWDGHLDFRIYDRESSGTGSHLNHHYIFDPESGRYRKCKELDDLSGPWFDDEDHTVHSLSRGGGMYSGAETYQWHGGKLYLVRGVIRGQDKKGFYTEYVDRRADGTLRRRRFPPSQ
jgi:hypothetical protein